MSFGGGILRRHRRRSRSLRRLAVFLVAAQAAGVAPMGVLAATAGDGEATSGQGAKRPSPAPARPPTPAPVKVNRTVPRVEPPALRPRFSEPPTDLEIFRARVFEEPLVPTSTTNPAENQALAQAVLAYLEAGRREDVGALEAFLEKHPASGWRASLLTNLGVVYRRTGYFSQAYASWEEAWRLARDETEPKARATAEKALGELAELVARLGRMDALEELLAEAEGRGLQGSVTEKITGAKEGLWVMRNRPEKAFRCGPMALDRILAATRGGYKGDALLTESRSTMRGTSLVQMQELAGRVGLSMQMAHRSAGANVLLPAMVHWKGTAVT